MARVSDGRRDKRVGIALSADDYEALVALGAATATAPAVLAVQILHNYFLENSEQVQKAKVVYEQMQALQLKLPGINDNLFF